MQMKSALIPAVSVLAILAAADMAASQDRKNVTLLGIPSGTVAPNGLVFAGISNTTRDHPLYTDVDRVAVLGFGFGNARDGVGFQVSVQTGFPTEFSEPAGMFSVKASRQISSGATPVFLGVSIGNLLPFGAAEPGDITSNVALTAMSDLSFGDSGTSFPIMMTMGFGSHSKEIKFDDNREPGYYAGIGIGLTKNLGASVAWGGSYWNAGVSVRFDGLDNLGLSATVYDVFDDFEQRRVTIAVSWSIPNAFGG
jgi:hypothetical protein